MDVVHIMPPLRRGKKGSSKDARRQANARKAANQRNYVARASQTSRGRGGPNGTGSDTGDAGASPWRDSSGLPGAGWRDDDSNDDDDDDDDDNNDNDNGNSDDDNEADHPTSGSLDAAGVQDRTLDAAGVQEGGPRGRAGVWTSPDSRNQASVVRQYGGLRGLRL